MDISFPYRNTMHTQTEDSFLHSKRSHQLSASLRSHVVSRSETNSCRGDGVHRPTNLRARRDGFWPSEIKLNPPSGQVLGIPQEPSSTTAIQYTLYRGSCSIGAQRERIHRVDHGAFPNRQKTRAEWDFLNSSGGIPQANCLYLRHLRFGSILQAFWMPFCGRCCGGRYLHR